MCRRTPPALRGCSRRHPAPTAAPVYIRLSRTSTRRGHEMPRMEGAVRRRWIPIVVAVACLVGGAAVYRLHGLFGAGNAALVGGARSEKIIEINPKNVTYQLFGPLDASGTISFLDGNSQPQTTNFVALPW